MLENPQPHTENPSSGQPPAESSNWQNWTPKQEDEDDIIPDAQIPTEVRTTLPIFRRPEIKATYAVVFSIAVVAASWFALQYFFVSRPTVKKPISGIDVEDQSLISAEDALGISRSLGKQEELDKQIAASKQKKAEKTTKQAARPRGGTRQVIRPQPPNPQIVPRQPITRQQVAARPYRSLYRPPVPRLETPRPRIARSQPLIPPPPPIPKPTPAEAANTDPYAALAAIADAGVYGAGGPDEAEETTPRNKSGRARLVASNGGYPPGGAPDVEQESVEDSGIPITGKTIPAATQSTATLITSAAWAGAESKQIVNLQSNEDIRGQDGSVVIPKGALFQGNPVNTTAKGYFQIAISHVRIGDRKYPIKPDVILIESMGKPLQAKVEGRRGGGGIFSGLASAVISDGLNAANLPGSETMSTISSRARRIGRGNSSAAQSDGPSFVVTPGAKVRLFFNDDWSL